MTKEERKAFETTLKTCNRCKHFKFAIKACCKDKKTPVYLNSFTNGDGYIHFLRDSNCEVS